MSIRRKHRGAPRAGEIISRAEPQLKLWTAYFVVGIRLAVLAAESLRVFS